MKKYAYWFIVIIMVISIFSCKNADDEILSGSESISGSGSEYLPISSNKILRASVTGIQTEYDESGKVTSIENASNFNVSGYIGTTDFVNGFFANQSYIVDVNNKTKFAGYIYSNQGEVLGTDGSPKGYRVTILPSDIKVGREWIINPYDNPNKQFKAKIVEGLESYTNSLNKTYKQVINVYVNYNDSTISKWTGVNWSYMRINKIKVDANVYLAKGVGVVGVKVNNYEDVNKYTQNYFGQTYYYTYKIIRTGTVGIIE
ncbi:MAG: hypothetical protein C0412_00080 [Flavobacterium sp.]|nr:hypothetical protein [Flavobacterium sp.]